MTRERLLCHHCGYERGKPHTCPSCGGRQIREYGLGSERVEAEIAKFDLQRIRLQRPEALSGGQMQKVALASILIMRPAFVLLDEPDSLLDAPSRREFMEAVEHIRKDHGILWACADAERLPQAQRYLSLTSSGVELASREQILETAY